MNVAISFQPEFVTAMFDVASSINQLNLNDTEIGLLAAVILATPGNNKLKLFTKRLRGARWHSGRALYSESRGPGFDPHRRHGVVSLARHINSLQYWLNPGSVGSVRT